MASIERAVNSWIELYSNRCYICRGTSRSRRSLLLNCLQLDSFSRLGLGERSGDWLNIPYLIRYFDLVKFSGDIVR